MPAATAGYSFAKASNAAIAPSKSSSLAFSACGHSVHYEHNNQGGAAIDLRSGSSFIGAALNDRTSSILWYR